MLIAYFRFKHFEKVFRGVLCKKQKIRQIMGLLRVLSKNGCTISYDRQMYTNLEHVFDKETAESISQDMADPTNSLQYYSLPECGQCSKCQAKND